MYGGSLPGTNNEPALDSAQTVPVIYSFKENQLIESIKASLNHELYENATFFAEQLVSLQSNEETRHLVAQCYLGK